MKKILTTAIAFIFALTLAAQERKVTELKTGDLPKGVSEYVSKNFKDGKINRAGKVEEAGKLVYVAVVESAGRKMGLLFDKDGKFTGKADPSMLNQSPATKGGTPKPDVTDPLKKTAPAATPTEKTADKPGGKIG